MVRASSRLWGQFTPCMFRWFHKRRQIPLTSIQTFNLKKKKTVGKGREAPGDVSRGECWQTQYTRKINHKASLRLDLFKIFAPHSREPFSHFPSRCNQLQKRRVPASCLIWGGEVLDVQWGTHRLWGSASGFPLAITTSARKRPGDLKLIREICSRRQEITAPKHRLCSRPKP